MGRENPFAKFFRKKEPKKAEEVTDFSIPSLRRSPRLESNTPESVNEDEVGGIQLVPEEMLESNEPAVVLSQAVEDEIRVFKLDESVRQKIIDAIFELRSERELDKLEKLEQSQLGKLGTVGMAKAHWDDDLKFSTEEKVSLKKKEDELTLKILNKAKEKKAKEQAYFSETNVTYSEPTKVDIKISGQETVSQEETISKINWKSLIKEAVGVHPVDSNLEYRERADDDGKHIPNEPLRNELQTSVVFDKKVVFNHIQQVTLKLKILFDIEMAMQKRKPTEEEELQFIIEQNQIALNIFSEAKKKHQEEIVNTYGVLGGFYDKTVAYYRNLEETPTDKIKKKFLNLALSSGLFLSVSVGLDMLSSDTIKSYKKLEETPKGRIKKEAIDAAVSGSLFLSTATGLGFISSNIALKRLAARVAVITGFQAAANAFVNRVGVDRLQKAIAKVPFLQKKSEENTSITQIPEFKTVNINVSDKQPSFKKGDLDSTIAQEDVPQIDLKKLKYAAMVLGTGTVFVLSGGFMAAVIGGRFAAKVALEKFIDVKKSKYETESLMLKSNIDFSVEPENFLAGIEDIYSKIRLFKDKKKKLKFLESFFEGAMTFSNGLASIAVVDSPTGGSERRVAVGTRKAIGRGMKEKRKDGDKDKEEYDYKKAV